MNLYYAFGTAHHGKVLLEEHGVDNVLLSYWYFMKDKKLPAMVRKLRAEGKTVMLDSGAFSAWRQGAEINLEEYINFIDKNKEEFDYFVNLDIIDEPELTEKNMRKMMDKLKIEPLTVYHSGEDLSVLDYLTKKYEYIGISPNNNWSPGRRYKWLDAVNESFSFKDHKFHCFGFTPFKLATDYSLFSADSTTWVQSAGRGRVFSPVTLKPLAISIEGDVQGEHFQLLPYEEKKLIKKFIKKEGFTLEKLMTSHNERAKFNIRVLTEIFKKERELSLPSDFQQKQLFDVLYEDKNQFEEKLIEEPKLKPKNIQEENSEEIEELRQRIIKGTNYLADLVNKGRDVCLRTILCIDCEKPKERRDLYCIAKSKLQRLEREYNELSGN